jgi:hypothetical protein
MYRRSEKIVYRADATHFRRKFCERVFQQLQALALIDHHYGSRSEAFRSISSSIFRAAAFASSINLFSFVPVISIFGPVACTATTL